MPLIAIIHIFSIRARINVDKENESQYGSDNDDGSKIDGKNNAFKTNEDYASDGGDKKIRMELLKIGNGNLSQMIWKLLIYLIIMMFPMG